MEIIFDISKDELPIFLAEVDEHLQVLDNVLLLLQDEKDSAESVQTVFRSAHTIKGMAGMIGHQRMTRVTHALENALDGVRKKTIPVSAPLIELCLKAVDCLRLLREEVATSIVSDVDVEEIVSLLLSLVEEGKEIASGPTQTPLQQSLDLTSQLSMLQVEARIDTNSMASAARAFQLFMALQDLGEIQTMNPSQQEIETAASVGEFKAVVLTDEPLEGIRSALARISGVDRISINGKIILRNGDPVPDFADIRESSVSTSVNTSARGALSQSRERRNLEPAGRRISDLTLRMSIEHMDSLMNLVGELITDRNHLQQMRTLLAVETNLNTQFDSLFEAISHIGRITDQLQEEVMSIRMLPIGSIFNKFPRMVHDISLKVGKRINLVVHGEETEMDRSMIDAIYDPLIHLIRNAVDHGIESPHDRLASNKPEVGTITLTARHEQGRIVVTVADDGRGIDGEKLRKKALQKGLISPEEAANLTAEQAMDLMFLAGLSTVENATEFSGRGVGLDIVKNNIQHVNGSIQVENHPGQGTQFQITLPLTLAIVPSLLVKVRQTTFALPMIMITETVRLEKSEIKYIDQKPVIFLRGSVLSLVRLSDAFNLPPSDEHEKHLFAVVIQSGKQRLGLIVDSLIGQEDMVVKPLGSFIGDIPGISSATILGNGQVALIVDIFNLFKQVL